MSRTTYLTLELYTVRYDNTKCKPGFLPDIEYRTVIIEERWHTGRLSARIGKLHGGVGSQERNELKNDRTLCVLSRYSSTRTRIMAAAFTLQTVYTSIQKFHTRYVSLIIPP